MAVITISRQMGSLGCQVADEVARCLSYKVVWREVINEAAIRAGVPEVALATIDELDLLGLRPSKDAVQAYHRAVHEIMRELHAEGQVVIVGRAGQVILRGMENVLHVRIYAPLELRVQRTAEKHQISLETARMQVETSDQARMRYLKRHYRARWDDPDLYDLMLNTANLDVVSSALLICKALEKREHTSASV